MQEGNLKSMFPGSNVHRTRDHELTWVHTLCPSPIGDEYKVNLVYKINCGVKFFVSEPKLQLAKGKSTLPHVYSTPKQQLCLYYPDGIEWNVGKLYTQTIIPWASEWLYHYEIWVGTGIWHGGGTTHPIEKVQDPKETEIK